MDALGRHRRDSNTGGRRHSSIPASGSSSAAHGGSALSHAPGVGIMAH